MLLGSLKLKPRSHFEARCLLLVVVLLHIHYTSVALKGACFANFHATSWPSGSEFFHINICKLYRE